MPPETTLQSASHLPGIAPTPADWAPRLRECAAELLLDQAHLEKKAAAGAVAFLFRVPADVRWQRGLAALAREELVHFERTLKLLASRGLHFGAQQPGDYAGQLKRGVARDMPARLVDELLVAAIIEGRSHERMGLLAEAFGDSDAELAEFYRDLVDAEARHEELYREIGTAVAGPETDVGARWAALVLHEAQVLSALPFGPRLHSGLEAACS